MTEKTLGLSAEFGNNEDISAPAREKLSEFIKHSTVVPTETEEPVAISNEFINFLFDVFPQSYTYIYGQIYKPQVLLSEEALTLGLIYLTAYQLKASKCFKGLEEPVMNFAQEFADKGRQVAQKSIITNMLGGKKVSNVEKTDAEKLGFYGSDRRPVGIAESQAPIMKSVSRIIIEDRELNQIHQPIKEKIYHDVRLMREIFDIYVTRDHTSPSNFIPTK